MWGTRIRGRVYLKVRWVSRRGPASMRRGIMLKTATRVQRLPSRVRKPFSLRSLTIFGVGEVLGEEFHHLLEDLIFSGVDLEAGAVIGDAEAVGDVVRISTWAGGFGFGQLAAPLDGEELPAGSLTLVDDAGAEGAGDDVADAFEVRHGWDSFDGERHRRSGQFGCQR